MNKDIDTVSQSRSLYSQSAYSFLNLYHQDPQGSLQTLFPRSGVVVIIIILKLLSSQVFWLVSTVLIHQN